MSQRNRKSANSFGSAILNFIYLDPHSKCRFGSRRRNESEARSASMVVPLLVIYYIQAMCTKCRCLSSAAWKGTAFGWCNSNNRRPSPLSPPPPFSPPPPSPPPPPPLPLFQCRGNRRYQDLSGLWGHTFQTKINLLKLHPLFSVLSVVYLVYWYGVNCFCN